MAEEILTENMKHPAERINEFDLIAPEVNILILTWVTFFLLLAVLYKFAWKPILAALDRREEEIRRSVEEVDKIHQEYERINETKTNVLQEAEHKAKATIAESRQAATNAAKVIEQKAKQEAQIILENTQRDIKAQVDRTKEALRQESAEVAIKLASKILSENLDSDKNRKLIDKLIKEI